MTLRGPRPDWELNRATAGLKEFQRATVRTVVDALYGRDQNRFLVADEVGLGKTKIARAVVVETIRRLWNRKDIDRIDIVYICSNSQIARQNIEDLRVIGTAARSVDRITMLPTKLADLSKSPVNVVAFSPHTSLKFGSSKGRAGERAMLLHLLSQPKALGPMMARAGARRLFELGAPVGFPRELEWARTVKIPSEVAAAYRRVLKRDGLIEKLEYYTDGRRRFSQAEMGAFVGRLRKALAEACITLLTPDLIILDEFQRFSDIMHGTGEAAELAQLLFTQPGAKVLLLSATPYKMLSGVDDEESHFEGFRNTVGFLLGDGQAARLDDLLSQLNEMRVGIVTHRDPARLRTARDQAEALLRSVMVRTERLAVARAEDGMLDTKTPAPCVVTREDVEAFVGTDRLTQVLDRVPSIVDYWKSAPYLVNFMDEYKIKTEVRAEWLQGGSKVAAALEGPHMLDWDQLNRYGDVNPRNGRTRWLIEDLRSQGAFDRLWLPPALPQTELRGAYGGASHFTKRLIFSGWSVVPKAIAGLISYEYERKQHLHGAAYKQVSASRLQLPVRSETTSDRFTTLALLLPCLGLVEIGDPLRLARDQAASLPLPLDLLRQRVQAHLHTALQPLLNHAATAGRSRNVWYAGALAYLDPGLLELNPADFVWDDAEGRGLADHLYGLRAAMDDLASWGPPPADLVEQLAELAIGGPAIVAARGLRRLSSRFDGEFADEEVRRGAAGLSWGFRSYFDAATAHALIGKSSAAGDYWSQVVQHCVDGGLGSVLDEWLHLIPDQLRLDASSPHALRDIVQAALRVLRLTDGRVSVDFFDQPGTEPRREFLRTHFAMRFGQAQGLTAEGENPVDVRNAFNSPFRPFVLVSTSIGQEGLDFHHYAHAIVRWNLPHNPVDLEQREGRVHRYKNHAVRKNIAAAFGTASEVASDDPWSTLFTLAEDDSSGMRPWWVYTGPAAIQRLVPMLPLSAEIGRLRDLVKATSLYRMTMGQPRQAELMDVLADLLPREQEDLRRAVSIDLAPR